MEVITQSAEHKPVEEVKPVEAPKPTAFAKSLEEQVAELRKQVLDLIAADADTDTVLHALTGTAAVIIGAGTTIKANDSGSYTAFTFPLSAGQVPQGEVEKVAIDGLWNPSAYRQKLPGYIDAGVYSFQLYYCAADYARLQAMVAIKWGWQVVIPTDGTGTTKTVTFSGWVKKMDTDKIEYDKPVVINVEVEISGGITTA